MKRLLLNIILFFFISFSSNAQQEWFIGVNASPNFTFRTNPLTTLDNEGDLSYHLGIDAGIGVDKNLMFRFGFRYIQFSETNFFDNLNLIFESDITGQGTDPIVEKLDKIDIRNNYNYLTAPLSLRVYLGKKKINWFIEPSLEPQFLMGSRTTQTSFDLDGNSVISKFKNVHNFNAFRRVNLSGGIAFGAEIPLDERFFITIQPHYQIQLLAATKRQTFEGMRLYSFGVQLGGNYWISK